MFFYVPVGLTFHSLFPLHLHGLKVILNPLLHGRRIDFPFPLAVLVRVIAAGHLELSLHDEIS